MIAATGLPWRSFGLRISVTTHSSVEKASATRGALIIVHSTGVSPEYSNSLTPRGAFTDVAFMATERFALTRLAANSPVSSMNDTLSLWPSEQNMMRQGLVLIMLKKEYGARLTLPSFERLEIHPIGRGATIAFNGSCGRPWPSSYL
jgi:hypothetical protein